MTVPPSIPLRALAALALLLLAACAAPPPREPVEPAMPEPEPEPPPREQPFEFDPDAPAGRIEALRLAIEQPDFRPTLALGLLLDLPLAELESLERRHGRESSLVPWLALARTTRAELLDDAALTVAWSDWQQRFAPDAADIVPGLLEWTRRWRQAQPAPSQIAVLLPDRAPLATAGNAVRSGLLEAWLEQPVARRAGLRFMDVAEGTDALAAIDDQGSELVIGPLGREAVGAALDRVGTDQQRQWLFLNRPPETFPAIDPTVPAVVLALPPEVEAQAIAERALARGETRALMVSEFSDYGRRVAEAFRQAFEAGGGEIRGEASYSPASFDHTAALARLLEVDRSRARLERLTSLLGQPVSGEPRPRGDHDLLFVAARGERMRQLMPQLRFLDGLERPVFATSDAWPGSESGDDLDGLIVPISPWMLGDGPAATRRERAIERFPALAGSSVLQSLHALGRDALALAPWIDEMRADPSLALPGELGRWRLVDGVTLAREPVWAQVRQGRLVPLSEP
ncbi:MAG: penicillin-binding protein activator [Wenzhouxiangellaceae bacterium]|nr:penicillin-binding protein activator [Wenzhouxiangellaceae bacterium]